VAGETASVEEDGLKHSQVAGVQRSRMLAATFQACAERGASGLSVADVVERAGISRRTFYELFDSSEDCLLAALDYAIGLAGERALAAYDPDAPWRARMRSGLAALLRFLDEQPEMARLLVVESLAAGPRAFKRRARAVARVVAAIDEGRQVAKKGRGEPPPLTAEGIAGGMLAVLHRYLVEDAKQHLTEILNPLMGMIVLPYLGAAAARAELEQPTPPPPPRPPRGPASLASLDMRLTYRTIRVLQTIAEHPGASNRQVGRVAGIDDPGQISKLLARLQRIGLIENITPPVKGAPNAWTLTTHGAEIQHTIAAQI
jgi:AcrR family transcriptional regulator